MGIVIPCRGNLLGKVLRVSCAFRNNTMSSANLLPLGSCVWFVSYCKLGYFTWFGQLLHLPFMVSFILIRIFTGFLPALTFVPSVCHFISVWLTCNTWLSPLNHKRLIFFSGWFSQLLLLAQCHPSVLWLPCSTQGPPFPFQSGPLLTCSTGMQHVRLGFPTTALRVIVFR